VWEESPAQGIQGAGSSFDGGRSHLFSADEKQLSLEKHSKRAFLFTHIIAGHFRTVMDDGTVDDLGPSDIAITPPGHDAMVVGDEPCVLFDFQGASRNV
jgi:hypothetical protein